ncbi:MAG: hypothetical protein JO157_06895 [Acetobacteraceae bacterium]|nr:hypothetical protein [Acetobacteraceae bacterium]
MITSNNAKASYVRRMVQSRPISDAPSPVCNSKLGRAGRSLLVCGAAASPFATLWATTAGPGLLGHGLLAVAGLSHLALFGGLLALFGATLLPGRTPLVTQLAERLDPGFHPSMAGYTRAVTWAWCLLFAGELLASLLLLLFAPAAAWSLFVNGLDVALVALMFLGEYGVRRLRFRGREHVPLATLVRAVRAGGIGR